MRPIWRGKMIFCIFLE